VGSAPTLLPVLETARKLAARNISVLITGESGTGKELLAQAIHRHSSRSGRRFVAINCGAIPDALLESELFGHRRGAFTGADRDHEGLVTAADGGTLFLDEIGTLPINVQTTLLRFLQEQEFYRVGDTTPKKVDVRIISATNQDMDIAIRDGEMREDLYYRLAVVQLRLPPLRERREDIPILAAHFVRQINERFGTGVRGFTPEAMQCLCEHDWPGNVRQLSNVIQASMAIEAEDRIEADTLYHVMGFDRRASEPSVVQPGSYTDALSRFEADYLRRLIAEAGGVVEDAAEKAGMNPATIYRKLKKYGLK
jgi:transcriptional regulator with PAS, ATPase and Fis domain